MAFSLGGLWLDLETLSIDIISVGSTSMVCDIGAGSIPLGIEDKGFFGILRWLVSLCP